MSELGTPQEGFTGLESIDFRIVAIGSLDPSSAAELQLRVCEIFSSIDGLSFSVTLRHGKPSAETEHQVDTQGEELRQWLDTTIDDLYNQGIVCEYAYIQWRDEGGHQNS